MQNLHVPALLLAGVLLITSQTGCRHCAEQTGDLPNRRLGGLNLNQPKEEVLEILGEPEAAATRLLMYEGDWKAHEIWRYRMAPSGGGFVVVFRDALVVEYGPLVGERATDLEELFEEPGNATTDADQ